MIWSGDPASPDVLVMQPMARTGQPVVKVAAMSASAARDALDGEAGVLMTDDPAALEYARTLSGYVDVPLDWNRTYVLLAPGRDGGGVARRPQRQTPERGVVRCRIGRADLQRRDFRARIGKQIVHREAFRIGGFVQRRDARPTGGLDHENERAIGINRRGRGRARLCCEKASNRPARQPD